MSRISQPYRVAAGDPVSAAGFDRNVDILESVQQWVAENQRPLPNGHAAQPLIFFATTSSKLPQGGKQFTDARYWLDFTPTAPGLGASDILALLSPAPIVPTGIPPTFVATNLAELGIVTGNSPNSGTHSLPAGVRVLVIALPKPANDGWVFAFSGASSAPRVKVLSANTAYAGAGSGGYYEASSVTGNATAAYVTGGGITYGPDSGETVNGTADVLVENACDIGRFSAWCIEPNTFHTGIVVGQSTEATPRPIVRVWSPPRPVVLGIIGSAEGSPVSQVGGYDAIVVEISSFRANPPPSSGGGPPSGNSSLLLNVVRNDNWGDALLALNLAEANQTDAAQFGGGAWQLTKALSGDPEYTPQYVNGHYLQHTSDGIPVFVFCASPFIGQIAVAPGGGSISIYGATAGPTNWTTIT